MIRIWLLATFTVLCVALAAYQHHWSRDVTPSGPWQVELAGKFVERGEYPSANESSVHSIQRWGSWNGNDDFKGEIRIGPFPARAGIKFYVSGYPSRPGNELYLEMVDLDLKLPLNVRDSGESWQAFETELPLGWRGRRVRLVASDGSAGPGGWLAISEPLRTQHDSIMQGGLFSAIAALLLLATGLAPGYFYFGNLLRRSGAIPLHWVPTFTFGAIALLGYLCFWAYLAHSLLGKGLSAAFFITTVGLWLRGVKGVPEDSKRTLVTIAFVTVVIGIFYLSLLHLYQSDRDVFDLEERRFIQLPGDNRVSHDIAAVMFRGQSPKTLGISSDRPPLQNGIQLLVRDLSLRIGISELLSGAITAILLQLVWVSAAFGLLRELGLSYRAAIAWTITCAFNGFIMLSSLYTWPKLSAGALGCAVFSVWFISQDKTKLARHIAGGALAGVAMLAHSTVAFAMLPLAPLVCLDILKGRWRPWLGAALAFTALMGPWVCYQKFYDPPGNRLVKWHIGGQDTPDDRGTVQTIVENYAAQGWAETIKTKKRNFAMQLGIDWHSGLSTSADSMIMRRNNHYAHLIPGLEVFLLGTLLLPLALYRSRNIHQGIVSSPLGRYLIWVAATVVCWCLLLFKPEAVMFHGPNSLPLVLLAILAASADGAKYGAKWFVITLQLVFFAYLWIISLEPTLHTLSPIGVGFSAILGCSLIALSVALLQQRKPSETPAH